MSEAPEFRLGVDVDGVLANFNRGFHTLLEAVSARNIPYEEPTVWDWPTARGYSKEDYNRAWQRVKDSHTFWANLEPMPEVNLEPVLPTLLNMLAGGHVVYFMTNRSGHEAHVQTMLWLTMHGMALPTVLICPELTKPDGTKESSKGYLAKGLDLTHFIDDKPENVYSVAEHSPATRTFLLARPWNNYDSIKVECFKRGIIIVPNLRAFFAALLQEHPIALT